MSHSYPRVQSVCPHDCPSVCSLDVERIDNKTIGRIYGSRGNRYTAGTLCAKVGRYAERVHHPDRLLRPLIRVGDRGAGLEAFEEIAWSEALGIVADKFSQLTEQYGAETIWPYYFAGTMGWVNRDGINRLRNVMGYSRQHASICTTLMEAGWKAGVGEIRGADITEIEHSELVVLWGSNPVNTQVNLMSHITRARKKGARLVVVDTYQTGSARKADQQLLVRPGTDGALACAVMHVLFRDGYTDKGYLEKYTDCPQELETHLSGRNPVWAAKITGLSIEEIERFAKCYGESKRSFIRVGYGFARSRNGAVNLHAVSCLPAITGAWQYPGGGAHYHSRELYRLDTTLIQASDRINPKTRILDMCRIGEVLTGNPVDLVGGPPVTGMLIQNTNPAVVAPDTNKVKRGLGRKDLFICVQEQFMTETAAMADIVLPSTMFLEHDDIYTGSGHTFFQIAKKVIDAPSECRSNHEVNNALLALLGGEHPAADMTEWEVIDQTLKNSNYPDAQSIYDGRGVDMGRSFREMHFLDGFPQKDGRFHFRADWAMCGPNHQSMPTFPDHFDVIDNATKIKPFRLVTAPARHYLNSSFTETPTSIAKERKPTLLIHPQDGDELGVLDGELVRMGNERGEIELALEYFSEIQRGVVVSESIWPGHAFKGGVGVNALTSSEPGMPNGGAVFHDTAVWLKALD
ncbi:MAG: molybdopterin-dependent oxidoreductase [Gammaproteobacteria bacterium]|nr:molybdopterin-dependent oxidoreductase [Gammaproteobacteria bacterium]